jgi:hypothetical protein
MWGQPPSAVRRAQLDPCCQAKCPRVRKRAEGHHSSDRIMTWRPCNSETPLARPQPRACREQGTRPSGFRCDRSYLFWDSDRDRPLQIARVAESERTAAQRSLHNSSREEWWQRFLRWVPQGSICCLLLFDCGLLQLHRNLLHDLNPEALERSHFLGTVREQPNTPQVKVGQYLGTDADFALNLLFVVV